MEKIGKRTPLGIDLKERNSPEKKRVRNIPNITSIGGISNYINDFRTENLVAQTDLQRKIQNLTDKIEKHALKRYLLDMISDSLIYKIVNKILPVNYYIVNVEGSEVQMVLSNCIAKITEIMDRAVMQDCLDGQRKAQMGKVMGALDELNSCIDPDVNELELWSPDSTHLHSMCSTIFVNCAKLRSLERQLYGEGDPVVEFHKHMDSLTEDQEKEILEQYLLDEFNIDWISSFDYNTKKLILHKIASEPDAQETIEPLIAVNFISKYKTEDKKMFFRHLAQELSISDRKFIEDAFVEK